MGFVLMEGWKRRPHKKGGFFVAVEPRVKPGSKKGRLQHMAQGTLRLFNAQKGYGIISPVHGGGDVFVRYSDIRGCREGAGFRSLQEGEKVTYQVAQHGKGVQAQNVAAKA